MRCRTYARRVLLSLIFLGCSSLPLRAQLPASLDKCLPYPTFQQELREMYPEDYPEDADKQKEHDSEISSLRIYGARDVSAAIRRDEFSMVQGHRFNSTDKEDEEDELAELTRGFLQNDGYFRVKTWASLRKTGAGSERAQYDAIVFVIEGDQYKLGRVTFRSAEPEVPLAFPLEQLRNLYPTQEGGIFRPEEVREWLHNIRRLYADHGYIDFTSEPRTEITAPTDIVNVTMVLDQGKQFRISDFTVETMNPKLEQALRSSMKPGDVFNYSTWLRLLKANKDLLPDGFSPSEVEMRRNVKDGTVQINVNALTCP